MVKLSDKPLVTINCAALPESVAEARFAQLVSALEQELQGLEQQYQQQINPQQQAMPAQQDMGMAAQLANQPVSFRNPDFYSEQRYLGFQPGGVRYQLP